MVSLDCSVSQIEFIFLISMTVFQTYGNIYTAPFHTGRLDQSEIDQT